MKASSNSFSRKSFPLSDPQDSWTGDNLGGGSYDDTFSSSEFGGEPYGTNEYGGIRHFSSLK